MFNIEARFQSFREQLDRAGSTANSTIDRACGLFWQTAGKNEIAFRFLRFTWDMFGVPIRSPREAINLDDYKRYSVVISDIKDVSSSYNHEPSHPQEAFLDDGVVAPGMAETIRNNYVTFAPESTESSLN